MAADDNNTLPSTRLPPEKVLPEDIETFEHRHLDEEFYVRILDALDTAPKKLDGLLAQLHPADIADLIERLPREGRNELIEHISDERFAEVLAELEPGAQEHILNLLNPEEVREVLEDLDSDDAADIAQAVEDLAEEAGKDDVEAEDFLTDYQQKRLLQYESDTAGGLMQLEVVTALTMRTVGEMLAHIRENEDELPANPGTIFVVNETRKLIGTVSLSRLVRMPLSATLTEVMRKNPLSVLPDLPEREVVRRFEKYDVHNLAVVNKRGQLLGRITIDDVLDVVLSDNARQQARSVGLDEDSDIFSPPHQAARQRLPWLLLNLVTSIAVAGVISFYETSIAALTVLAVLMPIISSIGGNATTQTQTVIIRGLALGQVTRQNIWALFKTQFMAGGYIGVVMCLLLAAGVFVIFRQPMLAVVILVSTLLNILIAALGGFFVPILLRRFGHDPAVSTGVITTAITDICGFLIFLALATWLLL